MTNTDKTLLMIALIAALIVLSIHFVPNHYCQAAFSLPCDITQGAR